MGFTMNIKDIEKLIKMLEGTNVKEISLEQEGFKITLLRDVKTNQVLETNVVQVVAKENTASETKGEVKKNVDYIKASMPGTFYRKPSPDAEPYVNEGDIVKENTVVCIIEAMKIFNEIKAGKKGKILRILVNDGESIEYDQPLFEIEKI